MRPASAVRSPPRRVAADHVVSGRLALNSGARDPPTLPRRLSSRHRHSLPITPCDSLPRTCRILGNPMGYSAPMKRSAALLTVPRAGGLRPAGAGRRRRLPDRLARRTGAAARHDRERQFLRLRGPRQPGRHGHGAAAARRLCGAGADRQPGGAEEAGADAGIARADAARRRQGVPGDRASAARQGLDPQADPGRRACRSRPSW